MLTVVPHIKVQLNSFLLQRCCSGGVGIGDIWQLAWLGEEVAKDIKASPVQVNPNFPLIKSQSSYFP